MGCTASKLDNEDTVRRCKDRRRLMKEVVHARHHLAAAHSDYCHSLRLTGSSLASFAAGEHIAVSDQAPAVYVRNTTASSASSISSFSRSSTMPRARPAGGGGVATPLTPMPEFFPENSSVARSESSISSSQNVKTSRYRDQNRDRYRKAPKLPHILSESSPNSSPGSLNSNFHATYEAKATYSRTPSQASSMWNWENFYPPSPPDSESFHRKKGEDEKKYGNGHTGHQQKSHHIEEDDEDEDDDMDEDDGTAREEVQCSEWGDRDRFSTTSSSGEEEEEDRASRSSEIGGRSEFGFSGQPPQQKESFVLPNKFANMSKADKFDDAESSTSYGGGVSDVVDMRMVVRHKDLAEIVAAIKENFDNAAAAGGQVSEMLETGRAQLDRSFGQLKKTVYHSSSVLSNISSTWSSKPPLAVKYQLDTGSLDEPGGPRSLCSTVERLLAWEKKLYQEVKAREGVKIEHEKKLATLQNQEYKGGDEVKLDKTKASIRRLQSLIIVTSQAASTTSTAITGLRDSDLVPQLAELCHGFMYMWRSMNQYHEVQNQIVQQVRGLVNRSSKGDSTSDLHRQATRDVESAVSLWHSSFCRLTKFQRDFVHSLHAWLKLTLLPISSDDVPNNRDMKEASSFCEEWKQSLDRLPDTVASEAINSFVNVVHSISVKQSEELKIKKRTETVAKELEKKTSSLRKIEKKYYHSYSMVGIGVHDSLSDNGHILDARDPLSEKKSELAACQRRVEDEMLRHTRAVEVTRAMTLNNIQTGLPGVFQAMASFSAVCTEALESSLEEIAEGSSGVKRPPGRKAEKGRQRSNTGKHRVEIAQDTIYKTDEFIAEYRQRQQVKENRRARVEKEIAELQRRLTSL